jgi:DNA uptake protein ComE-like DNA-binding protein
VLIVVALLMLIGYKYFNLMNAELEGAVAANKISQARRLADSGLHYAQFILAHPDTAGLTAEAGGRFAAPFLAYDNPELFHQRPVTDALGNLVGYFSLVSPRTPDDPLASQQSYRFGVEDESAKVNLNWLLRLNREDTSGERARDMIARLPNMTTELAQSITNWLRAGNDSGDSMYYASLRYSPKYGPFESLEELLYVRGITPRLLLGNDRNRNFTVEPDENDTGGYLDPGLSAYFTIYSRELNVDNTGQPRLLLNDTNLQATYERLMGLVGPDLAGFIMAYRRWGPRQQSAVPLGRGGGGGRRNTITIDGGPDAATLDLANANSGQAIPIPSIWSLVDAEVAGPAVTRNGVTTQTVYRSPLRSSRPEALTQYLPILLDKCTTDSRMELPARININTAPAEVLQALPGITTADVQKILSARPSAGIVDASTATLYSTPAWLMTTAQISANNLRQWEPYITTRSQVFRVQAVGYYETGGPMVRVEAVIDANAGRPRLLFWRDLSDLGRGFPFSQPKPILMPGK